MLNLNGLLGSLIGTIGLFLYVGVFMIVINKVLKRKESYYKIYQPEEHGFISSVFNVEGMQNAAGCWIYSMLYVVLHFWMINQNGIIKYAVMSIALTLTFQSLIGFIKEELLYRVNSNTNILISLISAIIVILFFTFSNIFVNIFVIILLILIECLTLYREFTGIWGSILDIKFYSFEDIVLLYIPPLVVLAAIIITML